MACACTAALTRNSSAMPACGGQVEYALSAKDGLLAPNWAPARTSIAYTWIDTYTWIANYRNVGVPETEIRDAQIPKEPFSGTLCINVWDKKVTENKSSGLPSISSGSPKSQRLYLRENVVPNLNVLGIF